MIDVVVSDEDGNILAHMKIERLGPKLDDVPYADYSVRVGVDRGRGEAGIHQRMIRGFPRLKLNVLALVKQALTPLGQEELELEPDTPIGSPDLARRQHRTGEEVPRQEAGSLRHYRPAFWRRQSE